MMNSLPFHLGPLAIGLIALFLAIVWMLGDRRDTTRPVLVLALTINLLYGFVLNLIVGQENGPWEYNRVLAALDASLGIDRQSIAGSLGGGWQLLLGLVYDLIVPIMFIAYMGSRTQSPGRRRPGSVVHCYLAALFVGPMLFAIVPASSTALGAASAPASAVAPDLIHLTGQPSAFPSLQIATAIVFVFFSRDAIWRVASLAVLAGAGLAAISSGEHYFIDLVAGAAFGAFAANAGLRRVFAAGFHLAIATGWSLAIRYQFKFLTDYAVVLKVCAALTIVAVVSSIQREWVSPTIIPAAEQPNDLRACYECTYETPLTGTDN